MAKQTPALKALRAQLRALNKDLADLQSERRAVLEAIVAEMQRATLAEAALTEQIVAKWDAGMTRVEIARVLNLTPRAVQQLLSAWRKGERTSVRRGQPLPERRQV